MASAEKATVQQNDPRHKCKHTHTHCVDVSREHWSAGLHSSAHSPQGSPPSLSLCNALIKHAH